MRLCYRPRWGDSLRPFQWTQVAAVVSGFVGQTEVDLPITCTYDLEVAGVKYFHALDDGEIPFLMLFSGTVFTKGETGFAVEQVPWHKEVSFGMPVKTWDRLMDLYYPGQAWIRMGKETLDALQRFKSDRALTNWDETLTTLIADARSAEEARPL